METFYHKVRARLGALMDGDQPVGGAWNLDAENRAAFGKRGPPEISPPRVFAPDETTRAVIDLVRRRFAASPGSMSDYCRSCRYDPKRAEGENACPFTTLHWDFLARHKRRFAANRRMGMQLRNLERKPDGELRSIRRRADGLKAAMTAETWG